MRRPKRGTRPSVRPQPVAGLLDDVFRWLKLDEPARAFRALRAFQSAAGPRIAARARAEKVRGAILYVRVTSSPWAHELHALKAELIGKLKRTPGGEGIEELRFSVGPLDDLPDWESLPSPAPRALPEAEPTPFCVELERAVEAVRDPELRDELSRLLGRARPR
ncbi:MAG TPA: DUF721 domain-containing protein [Polyangia bacterium]|jgi:hypothetical protein